MSDLPDEPVVERNYSGAFLAMVAVALLACDRRADLELHAFDAAYEVGGGADRGASAE